MTQKFLLFFSIFGIIFFQSCSGHKKADTSATVAQSIQSEAKHTVTSDYLITGQSAGKFRIGRTIPDQGSVAPLSISRETLTTTTEEGPYEETVYVLRDHEKVLLHLKPEFDYETMQYNQKTTEINIFSDQFRTEKGVGVGSTLGEFIEKYPDFRLWYTYVSGMFVVDSKELDAQFLLDPNDFEGDVSNAVSEITSLSTTDFKSGSKIIQVRLFKSDQ